jgi:hypothetical protein
MTVQRDGASGNTAASNSLALSDSVAASCNQREHDADVCEHDDIANEHSRNQREHDTFGQLHSA